MDVIVVLKEKGRKLSINQFNVALFSDDGNVDDFLTLLENNKIGNDSDKAYDLVNKRFGDVHPDHASVVKQTTAFNDYGNSVFRVLQLTGFVTVDYEGVLLLSPNENRIGLYKALKSLKFRITAEAKDSEVEYFEALGSFESELEELVRSYRKKKTTQQSDTMKRYRGLSSPTDWIRHS